MEKQANVTVSASADGNLSAHAQHQAAVQHQLHMQHADRFRSDMASDQTTTSRRKYIQSAEQGLREDAANKFYSAPEVIKKAAGNASVGRATVKREAKKIYNSLQNKPSRVNTSKGLTSSNAMSRGSLSGNSTKPVISEDDVLRLIARNAAKRKAGK